MSMLQNSWGGIMSTYTNLSMGGGGGSCPGDIVHH